MGFECYRDLSPIISLLFSNSALPHRHCGLAIELNTLMTLPRPKTRFGMARVCSSNDHRGRALARHSRIGSCRASEGLSQSLRFSNVEQPTSLSLPIQVFQLQPRYFPPTRSVDRTTHKILCDAAQA